MDGNNYFAPEYEDPSFHNQVSSFIHLLSNLPYYHQQLTSNPQIPMVAFCPQSSSSSYNNSSASDEAGDHKTSIMINERKQRRMISNRESARRSRMRKQKQLDELCTRVLWLRNQNHGLMDKLNKFLETHEQVIQENDRLKKETLELKQLLSEAQLARTYTTLRDLDGNHEEVSVQATQKSTTNEHSCNM